MGAGQSKGNGDDTSRKRRCDSFTQCDAEAVEEADSEMPSPKRCLSAWSYSVASYTDEYCSCCLNECTHTCTLLCGRMTILSIPNPL